MFNKNISLIVLLFVLLFSACSKREIVIQKNKSSSLPENTWALEGQNEKDEDVDISDLNHDVSTETPTTMKESNTKGKMERVRFPVEEYRKLATTGNGTIKGSIYLKTAYNKHIFGSNTRLYLNPITSYSKQWYNESYIGGYKMEKADSRLYNYLRFTTSNDQGQFAFYGVPSGSYYLIGKVNCAGECGYNIPKSIRIATKVKVKGNKVVQKNLTRLAD
ncbi:MAG: carboxypeptidase regulatory-like domain-containing protein [Sulfurovum sp.]|nr:MAG: carboxypeptidase regulatory-like domain-containing protein [Sulfurovum sp.]